jgi:hypothetical protein
MRPVNVFAAIHQRQQRAQNARFDFIGHRKPARSHAHQSFSPSGDLLNEFHLALASDVSISRFAPDFQAFLLDEKRVMKNAHMVIGETRRYRGLASF